MLYDLTVVQFSTMLTNLSAILDKGAEFAESKKIDVDALLTSRLALDQFNLIRQVQISCDSSKLGVARLTGKADSAPKHEDTETTMAELKARIKSVQDYLAGFSEADFAGAEERKVVLPWFEGKYLLGKDFAQRFALPNFYFHVSTAYAILRHHGVEVGKMDYLGAIPFQDL